MNDVISDLKIVGMVIGLLLLFIILTFIFKNIDLIVTIFLLLIIFSGFVFLIYKLVLKKMGGSDTPTFIIFLIFLMLLNPAFAQVPIQEQPRVINTCQIEDLEQTESMIIQQIDTKFNEINTHITSISEELNESGETLKPIDILTPVFILQLITTIILILVIRWR